MTKVSLHGMTVVILVSFASLASAQAAVHEPPPCSMPIEAINSETPPAPAADAFPRGNETSTLPWLAPVGHHQPQAADVTAASGSASTIDQAVLEENVRVDRLIKGICKGC